MTLNNIPYVQSLVKLDHQSKYSSANKQDQCRLLNLSLLGCIAARGTSARCGLLLLMLRGLSVCLFVCWTYW